MQHPSWKRTSRQTVHDSPHMRLHLDTVELPSGEVISDYSVVEFNDVVICVVTDIAGNFIMLEEYRYAVDQTMWNLPAGTIRRGTEDITAAALRELQEETGYTASDIRRVGELHDYPTKASHVVHVFRIVGAQRTSAVHHEVTENICVKTVSPAMVKKLLFNNEIKTSNIAAALVLALPELFGGALRSGSP